MAATVTLEPQATVPPPLVAPPAAGEELVLMVAEQTEDSARVVALATAE